MKIQFYCSSQFKEGYVYGEKNDGGQMKKISSTAADVYFVGGDISSALFRSKGQLILVLKGIKTPEDMKTRTDQTRSPIHINIVFAAQFPEEEITLRSVYLFSIRDESKFSKMLFEAFNESAGGETGYDFNQDKLDALLLYAATAFPLKQCPPLEKSRSGYYQPVDQQTLISLLTQHAMPKGKEDCVYLIKTELSQEDYVRKYLQKGQTLPWYVLGRGASPSVSQAGRSSSLFDRVEDFFGRFKWIIFPCVGILAIGIIALVIVLTRTVLVTEYSLYAEADQLNNRVTYSWEAKGATLYEATFNDRTETFQPNEVRKTYTGDVGTVFNFQLKAYGKNDKNGTVIGQSIISFPLITPTPTPVPTPVPSPTPDPQKVMVYVCLSNTSEAVPQDVGTNGQHTLGILIDGALVYESSMVFEGGDADFKGDQLPDPTPGPTEAPKKNVEEEPSATQSDAPDNNAEET